MPKTRQAREVALVLPRPAQGAPGTRLVRAVWDRARRFDLEAGGRFDRRGAAVLVWSAPFDAAGDRATPVGGFPMPHCHVDRRRNRTCRTPGASN